MSAVDNDSSEQRSAQTDARVLYAVLHAEGPVTVTGIADHLEESYQTAYDAMRRLFESGLVLRREAIDDGPRCNKYEYIVAPTDGHEPHVGAVSCSECGRESNVLAPGVECTYRYCEGVFTPA